jgi:hypothetical protein
VSTDLVNHAVAALARLPEQFKDKPNIAAFLNAINMQCDELEVAFRQLLLERGVDNAVGDQLDVIGRIVGQERAGLLDDDYRRYIRARISANRSRGTTEDMLTVARLVVYDDDATYEIVPQSIATAVRVGGVAISSALGDILFDFLSASKAAGVRLIVEVSPAAPGGMFVWDTPGQGWDNGVFADALS